MKKNIFNKEEQNLFAGGGFVSPYGIPGGFVPIGVSQTPLLDYDYRMKKLALEDKKIQSKPTKQTNINAGIPKFAYGGLMGDTPTLLNAMPKNIKAIGGVAQTNSADFSTGLTHINNGGSHEESPYDGVQIGTDEEGVPNLVEEGEVIFNDYVYSKRIQLDEDAKKKFHFPKKSELSYADAAKKLEKEVKERPNDPVSRSTFKVQMEQLADEQERQKQEMEAQRAKEAFEALSPEEQTALMQQKAQQDAMAEQAAQEQAIAEAQTAQGQPSPEEMAAMEQQAAIQQQMSPEEAAMMQQQMVAEQGDIPADGIPQAAPVQQPQFAEGGNLYPWGGVMDLFKVNPPYAASRMVGNIPYIQDENHKYYNQDAVIAEEGTPRFKAWTDYVNKYWNDPNLDDVSKKQIYDYLRLLDATAGGNHLFDKEGKMLEGAQKYFNKARTEDHKWGYYHLTPGQIAEVVDELKEVNRDVPLPAGHKELKTGTIGNETADLKPNDSAVRKPIGSDTRGGTSAEGDKSIQAGAAAEEGDKKKEESNFRLKPKYLSNSDIGLYMSAFPAIMQTIGIGKPDIAGYDRLAAQANRTPYLASWMPRGDFAKLRYPDSWFWTSPIIAQSNATQRAITNKVSPSGDAASIANGYNTMIALGNAQRQQEDTLFDRYMKTKQYNGTIYDANQRAHDANSQFNAQVLNHADQFGTQLGLSALAQKDDANRWWYSNLYQNIDAIRKRFDQRYKERQAHNTMADIWAGGLVPVSDKVPMASKYVEAVYGAEGGNVKRKKNKRKGFTV